MIDFIKYCHRILKHPAHRAERPFHVAYFILVGFYGGGPYAAAAICCAVLTVVSWGDDE